ncbi:ABC transporter permease [Rossellomorea sp. BNER]|uniref:ABC transporter permease n=1 Tax=Rossellomorea sp. BNER TaxID=2962031 RepID=UPI003AF274A7|nr:ABC transporter permease [Rossellomorea sp. BNER]
MLKLIRLEIKKNKLIHYLKGVVIANMAFIGLLCLIYFLEKNDGNIPFDSYDMAFTIIGTMVRATFIVFASVLIVRLIIEEYKTKSIEVLFTYPINRKKIMMAKFGIIMGFTFATVLLSSLFIGGLFYVADSIIQFVPSELSKEDLNDHLMNMFVGALATAGLSLIPIFFGMRKKSGAATIVSSIILVLFTNSTSNDFSLFSIIAIPITLGFIGVSIAFLSIKNIEKADVN